jgi:hypothetical protein
MKRTRNENNILCLKIYQKRSEEEEEPKLEETRNSSRLFIHSGSTYCCEIKPCLFSLFVLNNVCEVKDVVKCVLSLIIQSTCFIEVANTVEKKHFPCRVHENRSVYLCQKYTARFHGYKLYEYERDVLQILCTSCADQNTTEKEFFVIFHEDKGVGEKDSSSFWKTESGLLTLDEAITRFEKSFFNLTGNSWTSVCDNWSNFKEDSMKNFQPLSYTQPERANIKFVQEKK